MRISSKQVSYQGSRKLFKNKGARAEIVATVCLILSVQGLRNEPTFKIWIQEIAWEIEILTVDLNQVSKGRFTAYIIIKMQNVISYSSYHIKAYFSKNLAGLKTPLSLIGCLVLAHLRNGSVIYWTSISFIEWVEKWGG